MKYLLFITVTVKKCSLLYLGIIFKYFFIIWDYMNSLRIAGKEV